MNKMIEAVVTYALRWHEAPETLYAHPRCQPMNLTSVNVNNMHVPIVRDINCPVDEPFALGTRAARQHTVQWLGSDLYYTLFNVQPRPAYWDGHEWCSKTWDSVRFGIGPSDYIFRRGDH